jgi:hypothetical protein
VAGKPLTNYPIKIGNGVKYTCSQMLDPNYSPFNIDSNKMEIINARKVSRFSECPTKDFKKQYRLDNFDPGRHESGFYSMLTTTTTPQISNTPQISKFDKIINYFKSDSNLWKSVKNFFKHIIFSNKYPN